MLSISNSSVMHIFDNFNILLLDFCSRPNEMLNLDV